MSLVLNEYKWAEDILSQRVLGVKPSLTLQRLAKYFHSKGLTKNEIRVKLEEFLVQCDPNISVVMWSDSLDRIMKSYTKHSLINIDNVIITVSELKTINLLQGRQLRRLAFTLLCIAKYWNSINPDNNNWVSTMDRDIMRMANINTSIKRQSIMFSELSRLGLISFSKRVDNLSVQVNYIKEGSDAVKINDFRNLGDQYQMLLGEPYFKCVNCGITTKIKTPVKGRPQKYCANCATQLHTKQKVESVMRKRNMAKIEGC